LTSRSKYVYGEKEIITKKEMLYGRIKKIHLVGSNIYGWKDSTGIGQYQKRRSRA